jgi:site-specific recombinase XerC
MIAGLKAKGLAANTIRLAVASLRSVLSAAVLEKVIPENPGQGFGIVPLPARRRKRQARSMEPSEASSLFAAALESPDGFPLFLIASPVLAFGKGRLWLNDEEF